MRINNVFGTKFKGAIGKDIIASSWKGKEYIKAYKRPKNPRSERQQRHRSIFAKAVTKWHGLSLLQQEFYNRIAEEMTGYNLFISRYIEATRGGREPEVPVVVTWNLEGKVETEECILSVLHGQRQINIERPGDEGGEVALTRSDAPYKLSLRRGRGEDGMPMSADNLVVGGSFSLRSRKLGISVVLSVRSS